VLGERPHREHGGVGVLGNPIEALRELRVAPRARRLLLRDERLEPGCLDQPTLVAVQQHGHALGPEVGEDGITALLVRDRPRHLPEQLLVLRRETAVLLHVQQRQVLVREVVAGEVRRVHGRGDVVRQRHAVAVDAVRHRGDDAAPVLLLLPASGEGGEVLVSLAEREALERGVDGIRPAVELREMLRHVLRDARLVAVLPVDGADDPQDARVLQWDLERRHPDGAALGRRERLLAQRCAAPVLERREHEREQRHGESDRAQPELHAWLRRSGCAA
jgi:hypothetical protein